jgi:hypothetical protein
MKKLIAYAGRDEMERLRKAKKVRAYELFGIGWDTWRIAKLMNIPEAEAVRLVALGRKVAA